MAIKDILAQRKQDAFLKAMADKGKVEFPKSMDVFLQNPQTSIEVSNLHDVVQSLSLLGIGVQKVIEAVQAQNLEIPDKPVQEVTGKVTTDVSTKRVEALLSDVVDWLQTVAATVKAIPADQKIEFPEIRIPKTVTVDNLDTVVDGLKATNKNLVTLVKRFDAQEKIEIPATDLQPIVDKLSELETAFASSIGSIRFPIPPTATASFKKPGTLENVSVVLNSDGSVPVTVTNTVNISGTITASPVGTQDVNLTKVGGAAFALGQQLAGASLPIVLTAAQLATLTPLTSVGITNTLFTVNQGTSPWSVNFTNTVIAVSSISSALPSGDNVIGRVKLTNSAGTVVMDTVAATETIVGVRGMAMFGSDSVNTQFIRTNNSGVLLVAPSNTNSAFNVTATVVSMPAITGTVTLGATANVAGTVTLAAGITTTATIANTVTVTIPGVVTTAQSTPSTIFNGRVTVTTAGTRTTLAASTPIKSVTLRAADTNTGYIFVGNATVTGGNGYLMSPGDVFSMDIADLNTVNVDASVNSQVVTYLATN